MEHYELHLNNGDVLTQAEGDESLAITFNCDSTGTFMWLDAPGEQRILIVEEGPDGTDGDLFHLWERDTAIEQFERRIGNWDCDGYDMTPEQMKAIVKSRADALRADPTLMAAGYSTYDMTPDGIGWGGDATVRFQIVTLG